MPASSLAGATDLDLFSSGGNIAPNTLIVLDNSGSMDSDLSGAWCGGACYNKREMARDAVRELIDGVNPDNSGTREENARFGLMTYRANGAFVEVAIGEANATQDIWDEAGLTASRGVGTPVAGALLDAGRYYAGTNPWGTLNVWGDETGDGAQNWSEPIDLACRNNFVLYLTDGEFNIDSIIKANFWDTIGDSDGDLGIEPTLPVRGGQRRHISAVGAS